MDADRIEEIRETIEDLKDKKSKAQGRLEGIESTWKDDYEIDSLEDAEKLIKKLEKERDSLQEKETDLEKEIEELVEGLENE